MPIRYKEVKEPRGLFRTTMADDTALTADELAKLRALLAQSDKPDVDPEAGRPAEPKPGFTEFRELMDENEKSDPPRLGIRILVGVLGGATFWYAFIHAHPPDRLPGVALGQPLIYRGEVLLALFYAGLLLLTPLFQGAIKGRLPTEISSRGAKYDPEQVSAGLQAATDRLAKVDSTATASSAELIALRGQVAELRERLDSL